MSNAVADPGVQDTAPVDTEGYESHISGLIAEDEEMNTAQEDKVEDVDKEADDVKGQDEKTDEGTTDVKVEENTTEDGDKEPATVEGLQAKLSELERRLAQKDEEVAQKQKSIDEQGNRFMGTKRKIQQLESSLTAAQQRLEKLGDAPDHLEDFSGATKHVQQQNALESQVQREGAELAQLKQIEARARIEYEAAKEFAPEHAEMVSDLHALWKKDVPKYEGTVEQFADAMYRDIPASTIISMVKRVQAEKRVEELASKVDELLDKFGKAGKQNKKLVGSGSGGASARPEEGTEGDSDITDLFGTAKFASLLR